MSLNTICCNRCNIVIDIIEEDQSKEQVQKDIPEQLNKLNSDIINIQGADIEKINEDYEIMCEQCLLNLEAENQQKLQQLQNGLFQYQSQLDNVSQTFEQLMNELDQYQKENLQNKLDSLKQEIERLQKEEEKKSEEFQQLLNIQQDLLIEEDKQIQDTENLFIELRTEQNALEKHNQRLDEQIKDLENSHVLSDNFEFVYDDQKITLNKLILTSQEDKIIWEEVNDALGQMCLLVHFIAKKNEYKFEKTILHPGGSFSYIISILNSKPQDYQLFLQFLLNSQILIPLNSEEDNKSQQSFQRGLQCFAEYTNELKQQLFNSESIKKAKFQEIQKPTQDINKMKSNQFNFLEQDIHNTETWNVEIEKLVRNVEYLMEKQIEKSQKS